jgi:hypothetical protein
MTQTTAPQILPVTGHKFFFLFLILLADLILYPYMGETGVRYDVFRAVGVVVTFMAVYAVSFRRGLILVALLLAGPAIVEHSVVFRNRLDRLGGASIFNVVLSFMFDVFIIVVIFHRVYAREKPTAETIFGAVCVYLLIGFSFARLYAIIAIAQPHAFYLDPATSLHSVPVGFDFIFFSFGSMTTAGAAGITAVSPQVRSVSMIESILAVLYLAVMISRLMDAYRPNYPSSSES